MEITDRRKLSRHAGWSTGAFAAGILLSSTVLAFWHGFFLDVIAIAVLGNSSAVARGSHSATTLVLVLMIFYVLAGAAILVGAFLNPSFLTFGGQPIEPHQAPWAMVAAALAATWATANVVLLVKVRRASKPTAHRPAT